RLQRDVAALERAGHVDGRIGIGQADERLPVAAVARAQRDVAGAVAAAVLVDHGSVQEGAVLHLDVPGGNANVAAVARRRVAVVRLVTTDGVAGVDGGAGLDGPGPKAFVLEIGAPGPGHALDRRIGGIDEHPAGLPR